MSQLQFSTKKILNLSNLESLQFFFSYFFVISITFDPRLCCLLLHFLNLIKKCLAPPPQKAPILIKCHVLQKSKILIQLRKSVIYFCFLITSTSQRASVWKSLICFRNYYMHSKRKQRILI